MSVSSAPQPRRVLWAANVRTKSLEERLEIARRAGFSWMSVFPIDYRRWTDDEGRTPSSIRRLMRGAGVKVVAVDPYTQWVPGFAVPDGYPADYLSFIDFDASAILRIADALEAEAINCVEGLGASVTTSALIDGLGAFAHRAEEAGRKCHLEFMPISAVANLDDALTILGALDDRVTLTFDTWHFFRSESSLDRLSDMSPRLVGEVQLADAQLELRGADLNEDLLRYRQLPGEGELAIGEATRRLQASGALRSVGPEVFADEMDALTVDQLVLRLAPSLDPFIPQPT